MKKQTVYVVWRVAQDLELHSIAGIYRNKAEAEATVKRETREHAMREHLHFKIEAWSLK